MQALITQTPSTQKQLALTIARFAVEALLEEVCLTPKPGLVDYDGNGCHQDLNLPLMVASAASLYEVFYDMAVASAGKQPTQQLREQLAAIGRYGEQRMLNATGNINTHKGAIWCLGLLTAATTVVLSQSPDRQSSNNIFNTASKIAVFTDRFLPVQSTNGGAVRKKYNVMSAREEAIYGFPSISGVALPTSKKFEHEPDQIRKLNMLLALMSSVDDTCILHRSNMMVLREMQEKSVAIIQNGGVGLSKNQVHYLELEKYVTRQWVSPGGSADLLAGAIFIQKISDYFKFN